MALQVRRGTNAERIALTPLEGELVFTTDTKQLYVGDGVTAGGITSIANTIDSLLADNTPQLGGELDLNGNNITGTGNINITGTITATGNINLGDGVGSDIVVFGGAIQGHLVPDTDTTWNLGSETKQFNEAWISQLNVENQLTVGRIMGDIIADDSTVVFDSSTGLVASAQLTGTLPAGVIPAAMSSNITGNLTGNAAGDHTGTFAGSVTATGTLDGDLIGSVFGDDSTTLVDGVSKKIVGDINSSAATIKTINNQNIEMANVDGEPLIKIISETNTGSFGVPVISINNNHTGTYGQEITFNRSNGTFAAPTATQSGDYTASITARAHDGNDYTTIGAMHVVADDVRGTDDVDSCIYFFTRNGSVASDYSTMLKLGKGAEVSGYVQFGSYTTGERNALTPAFGMVIYNTTTNVFEGYQNTSGTTPQWVALS